MPPRRAPSSFRRRTFKRKPLARSRMASALSVRVPTVSAKQTVVRAFNPVAGRPQRPLTSLLQYIQVQATGSFVPFATSGAALVFAAQTWSLSTTPAIATAYAGAFDQYRIEQIECWFEPVGLNQDAAPNEYTTCVDISDAVVPTTFSTVADHQGAITTNTGAGHYHAFKPHVTIGAANSVAVLDGLVNSNSPWVAIGTPNLPHLGIKFAMGASAVTIVTINLSWRLTFGFRAPTTA